MRELKAIDFIKEFRKLTEEIRRTNNIEKHILYTQYLNVLYRLGLSISFITDTAMDINVIAKTINEILKRTGKIKINVNTVLVPEFSNSNKNDNSNEVNDIGNTNNTDTIDKETEEDIKILNEEYRKEEPEEYIDEDSVIVRDDMVDINKRVNNVVNVNDVKDYVEAGKEIEEDRYRIKEYINDKETIIEIRKGGKEFIVKESYRGKKNKKVIIIPSNIRIVFDISVHSDIEEYLKDKNMEYILKEDKKEKVEVKEEVKDIEEKVKEEKEIIVKKRGRKKKTESKEDKIVKKEKKEIEKITYGNINVLNEIRTNLLNKLNSYDNGNIIIEFEGRNTKPLTISADFINRILLNPDIKIVDSIIKMRKEITYISLYEYIKNKVLNYKKIQFVYTNLKMTLEKKLENIDILNEKDIEFIDNNLTNIIRLVLAIYIKYELNNDENKIKELINTIDGLERSYKHIQKIIEVI